MQNSSIIFFSNIYVCIWPPFMNDKYGSEITWARWTYIPLIVKPSIALSPLSCGCGGGSYGPTWSVPVGWGEGGHFTSLQWWQHCLSPTTTTTTATAQRRGLCTHVGFILKAATTMLLHLLLNMCINYGCQALKKLINKFWKLYQ